MIRTLAIIAGAGFLTFVVCLASVLALGGPEIIRDGLVIPAVLQRIEQGEEYEGRHAPRSETTLDWAGAEELTIDVPGDVAIVPGDKPGITISGTTKMVQRVRVEGGRIFWADSADQERHIVWSHDRNRLKILVTAPNIRKVNINGSADVSMDNYAQPHLAIAISGSGDLTATGRTEALTVDISGSGSADLRRLPARTATLSINGSGDIEADASDSAVVRVSGSGDVTLSRPPTKLDQDVAGSGDVYVGDRNVTPDEDEDGH